MLDISLACIVLFCFVFIDGMILKKNRCPHCKAFASSWDAVAKAMVKDNSIIVGKFNCEKRLVSESLSYIYHMVVVVGWCVRFRF